VEESSQEASELSQTSPVLRDPESTPRPLPRLRREIEIVSLGAGEYLLVDPRGGSSFELDRRERALIELLDGSRREIDILRAYETRFGDKLDPSRLADFLQQLHSNGLLTGTEPDLGPTSSAATRREDALSPEPQYRNDRVSGLNLLFDFLVLMFGFVLHPVMVVPILALAGVALLGGLKYWEVAYQEWGYLFETVDVPIFIVLLLQKILLIDLPKSVVRGMACRRFRGRIRGFGLRFHRGLVPYIDCDVGDSLGAVSRRGQWTLLTAGIWCQVAIAAVAVLAWLSTVHSSVLSHFYLITAIPAVFGLILQLNVFLPLGGYQLLSFWLEVPDLWSRARAETRSWILFRPPAEPLTRRERFWFRIYGLTSYVCTVLLTALVVGFTLYVLTSRFGRVGALGGTMLVLLWFTQDFNRKIMNWEGYRWLVRAGGKWYVRWPVRILLVVALLVIAQLPYAHEISGDCRVIPAMQYGARAQVRAEIVEIHVKEGDIVRAGDLLATMTDREVGAQVAETRAALEEALAEHELRVNGPLPEEIAVLEREVDRLTIEREYRQAEAHRTARLVDGGIQSQAELDQQVRLRDAADQSLRAAREKLARGRIGTRLEEIAASEAKIARLQATLNLQLQRHGLLELRTPIAGRVVTRFMNERLGQVAEEGDLICVVESTDMLAEVLADEAAAAEVQEGMEAELRLWGLDGVPVHGRVVRRAQSAWSDGLSNVAVRSDREMLLGRRDNPLEDDSGFRVYIELDSVPQGLVSGMTGYSKIRVKEERLWQAFSRPVLRFFRTEVWSWLP
jgi:putative peptide zinc metalloprotease protein